MTRIILKLKPDIPTNNFIDQENRDLLNKMGLRKIEPAYSIIGNHAELHQARLGIGPGFLNTGSVLILEFDNRLHKEKILENLEKLYSKKIEYVEEDQEIVFFNEPVVLNGEKENLDTMDYPLGTINFSKDYQSENEVIVAVIDSGVNYDHKALRKSLWSASSKGKCFGINMTISHNADWTNVKDNIGHGSMVAGIIGARDNPVVMGIAPSAKLLSIKVFPKHSATYFVRDVCSAMMNAYWTGAKVINNSWRLLKSDGGNRKFLTETLQILENNNCISVFAAGNEDRDCSEIFPQSLPAVLNVGSINKDLKRQDGTNWGDGITIWAPGAKINSTYKGGVNSYEESSGTSFAAPFVTGVVALLKAKNPNLSLFEVKEILRASGKPITIAKNNMNSYLLDFSKTLNLKPFTNLNSKTMNSPFPKPPENKADINATIFTFLHLERSDIFQLLHNDVRDDNFCNFQIFGCFQGNKVVIENKEKFLVEKVALKLVNMDPNSDVLYTIGGATMKTNTKNEVDFAITTIQTGKPVKGVDFTLEQLFLLERFQKIDYHVGEGLDSGGYPCNQSAFF
ncbi:hypothetical protein FGM00_16540 [Aggregatimonas sangjinii]|uniref:Peptidase S8/S53 domain-containing protein n=1 Tax=Aggregatimonas sangjinii TaxID=2583587 RepID=A0A5B7SY05_9FLAO|nr:S8 family serine peptidase [Aggregatimonas sangjinii]QCX01640.1 hypothetical protein FGM00_16540 [Aggregatimonas sangjinii]